MRDRRAPLLRDAIELSINSSSCMMQSAPRFRSMRITASGV